MIDIEFAELHNALFMCGVNLQLKLDPKKRPEMKLQYDRENKELLVTYKDRTAIVPTTNVSAMIPVHAHDVEDPTVLKELGPSGKITAQVDTPMSHVFAGPGHGKTGFQEKVKSKHD